MKTVHDNIHPALTRARILQLVVGFGVPLALVIASFLLSRTLSVNDIFSSTFLGVVSAIGMYASARVAIDTTGFRRLIACVGIAISGLLTFTYGVVGPIIFLGFGPW